VGSRWRIRSVRHEGVEYFTLFALNPAEGYQPYPVVADVVRILSRILIAKTRWGYPPVFGA
jgi:hypothetical protein